MKRVLPFLVAMIFSFAAYTQIETVTVEWTKIKMAISSDSLGPRELFKINDTTLYLGCRNYLLKVAKDSLRIEFEEQDKSAEHMIRSVVSYNDVLYVSNKVNSVVYRSADGSWVNLLEGTISQGNYNWEMVIYKSELIYTTWPRWIKSYNFETKFWMASIKLDQQGAGYISGFEKTKDDLFVSLYGGGVYKKDRASDNWINCNKGLPENLNVRSIAAVENECLFAATENGVYYSKQDALNWKPCKQTQGLDTKYVDLMYHNKILYATGTNGELMVSKDFGKKWIRIRIRDSNNCVLYSIAAIGPDLYLSADGQGIVPSGVFTIPINYLTSYKFHKKDIVSFQ